MFQHIGIWHKDKHKGRFFLRFGYTQDTTKLTEFSSHAAWGFFPINVNFLRQCECWLCMLSALKLSTHRPTSKICLIKAVSNVDIRRNGMT